VIIEHLAGLEAVTSTKQACALLRHGRQSTGDGDRCHAHRRRGPRKQFTEVEGQRIVAVLRSWEYCDLAPAQV
jgi:hypothetical protein